MRRQPSCTPLSPPSSPTSTINDDNNNNNNNSSSRSSSQYDIYKEIFEKSGESRKSTRATRRIQHSKSFRLFAGRRKNRLRFYREQQQQQQQQQTVATSELDKTDNEIGEGEALLVPLRSSNSSSELRSAYRFFILFSLSILLFPVLVLLKYLFLDEHITTATTTTTTTTSNTQENKNITKTKMSSPSILSSAIAGEGAGNGMDNNIPAPPPAAAQILTKATMPLLTSLDASDAIEVYALTRMAKLKVPGGSIGGTTSSNTPNSGGGVRHTLGGSNSTSSHASSSSSSSSPPTSPGIITIQKSAIAFRYRHQPSTSGTTHNSHYRGGSQGPNGKSYTKPPFELTLEYGPQRTGATLDAEAMPIVATEQYDEDNNDPSSASGGYQFLSWENEGKVYYEQQISQTSWTEAYYMASTTGAVLGSMIQYAEEYSSNHPRYQPFQVMAKDTNKIILRSSSSEDFVWSMLDKLADLYVNMEPILVPPRYVIRFYVENKRMIKKLNARDYEPKEELIQPSSNGEEGNEGGGTFLESNQQQQQYVPSSSGKTIATLAAEFYEKFYACGNAIRTGDYSRYDPTPSPTAFVSNSPSAAPSPGAYHSEEKGVDGHDVVGKKKKKKNKHQQNTNNDSDNVENNENDGDGGARLLTQQEHSHHLLRQRRQQEELNSLQEQVKKINAEHDDDDDEYNDDDDEDEDASNDVDDDADSDQGGDDMDGQGDSDDANVENNATEAEEGISAYEKDKEEIKNEADQNVGEAQSAEATTEAVTSPEDSSDSDADTQEEDNDAVDPADENNDDQQPIDNNDAGDNKEEAPAEAAAEAAQAAAEAAEQAKQAASSTAESAAADAAEAAAVAAQKAAKATSTAAANKAMVDLLSGDGHLMTSVLSSCFTDQKYGIRRDISLHLDPVAGNDEEWEQTSNNMTEPIAETVDITTTYAYLYLDGANYYRLNLTPPYWSSEIMTQPVPQPQTLSMGRGDLVDWTLATCIIGGFIFGILVLLQHMGIKIHRKLSFRWFFDPHEYVHPGLNSFDEGDMEDFQQMDRRKGGGFPHSFAEDAIPVSLGGRKSRPERFKQLGVERNLEDEMIDVVETVDFQKVIGIKRSSSGNNMDGGGHVELMPTRSGNAQGNHRSSNGGTERDGSRHGSSFGADENFDIVADPIEDQISMMKGALSNEDMQQEQLQKQTNVVIAGGGVSPSVASMSNSTSKSRKEMRRSPVTLPLPNEMRMARDPDLVDLPTLRSSSKVAIPVGAIVDQRSLEGDSNSLDNNSIDSIGSFRG